MGELKVLLGIVQPTLSQQIMVLSNEELVSTRREGKNIYYRLIDPDGRTLIEVLYERFCESSKGVCNGN